MTIINSEGHRYLQNEWIVCPNEDFRKITLKAKLHTYIYDPIFQRHKKGQLIQSWNLLPNSFAKVFPDYIPKPILEDYQEAMAILELSPKASATLSRRCLQGMIRDYWRVSKARLVDEINAIEEKVDPLTWKSIDAVRKVGNIGAHMEKDINIIVDVDPREALLLTELIELLFTEWYVHRHEREIKLKAIVEIADKKKEEGKK
jgi:hypothetical protein